MAAHAGAAFETAFAAVSGTAAAIMAGTAFLALIGLHASRSGDHERQVSRAS